MFGPGCGTVPFSCHRGRWTFDVSKENVVYTDLVRQWRGLKIQTQNVSLAVLPEDGRVPAISTCKVTAHSHASRFSRSYSASISKMISGATYFGVSHCVHSMSLSISSNILTHSR